jgi:aminopeptidase YwaD
VLAAAAATLALLGGAPADDPGYRFARSLALAGPRPAAGRLERRAQARVARRFADAGLAVTTQPVPVPRLGRSRNVIGALRRPADCLFVVMAHADTVPPSPGAEDNASGLGLLAALAPRLELLDPPCTVWLVATGAEERIYTGSPDHLGALALRRIVPRRRLRYALSLDEVGRGASFRLRSPVSAPRRAIERELLAAAAEVGVSLDWQRDSGTGNSDHREFELAGMPGVKLGALDNPCRHQACDTHGKLRRSAFRRVQRVVEAAIIRL